MSTINLITELIDSYKSQIELYRNLKNIVQKIHGSIVLSRGDLTQVMGLFTEKQKLLDTISQERERISEKAETWQREKDSIPQSEDTLLLDSILQDTGKIIEDFLRCEDQLKKYLEHLMKPDAS